MNIDRSDFSVDYLKSALSSRSIYRQAFPKELELAYRKYVKRSFVETDKYLCIILAITFFLFISIDLFIYPSFTHPLVISRLTFSTIAVVLVYLVFISKSDNIFKREPINSAATIYTLGAVSIIGGSFLCPQPYNYAYLIGILPICFAVAISLRNSASYVISILVLITPTTIFILFLNTFISPFPEGDKVGELIATVYVPMISVFLLLCAGMSIYIALIVSLSFRHQWLSRQIMEHESNALKTLTEQLTQLSNRDELTGVANRRCFMNTIEEAYNAYPASSLPLSVIMLDVDYFKRYNDSYGHEAGDECLKIISGILKKHAQRNTDLLARYGGEEFMLLLLNSTPEHAERVANSVVNTLVNANIPHNNSPFEHVTVSLGVITAMNNDLTIKELIKKADIALYKAKAEGRNRACIAQ